MARAMSGDHQLTRLVLLYLLMTILALLVGIGVGIGFYLLVAFIILLVPAVFLVMRPDIGLVLFAALTLLIAGTLKYFFGLGQFQWVLSVLGAALLGYSLVQKLLPGTAAVRVPPADGITQAMLLWWVVILFASAANTVPPLDWLVGLRIYLPAFGIFTYLAYCRPSEKLLKGIVLLLLAIASVQWAFALFQNLYVVPMRIAEGYPGSPWDSVVGSFGGDKFGGGESGSLGIYLSITMAMTAALSKYRQIKSLPLVGIILTGFAAMALTESKVFVIMIPLGIFLVYRDYAFKQPVKFLAGATIIAVLMFSLLTVYYYMFWESSSRLGLFEALVASLIYSFDPHFQASTNNLGRVGSLIFWWDNHSIQDNPLTLLIGHGLASAVTFSAIIGEGAAVNRHGIILEATGVSKLLWESGLIGLLIFLLVFVFGFFRARHLKQHPLLPTWHRAVMVGVEAGMVLMPLSIFYEATVVSSPPMQFMAMFMLGYVAYWWRETDGGRYV